MKLFQTIKRILSKSGELHFKRFAIIDCKYFGVYIHRVYKKDEDDHLHDHPWNYSSLIIKGWMLETTLDHEGSRITNLVKRWTYTSRNQKHFHKISYVSSGGLTTLFFRGPRISEWGYEMSGYWVDNVKYRKIKNGN